MCIVTVAHIYSSIFHGSPCFTSFFKSQNTVRILFGLGFSSEPLNSCLNIQCNNTIMYSNSVTAGLDSNDVLIVRDK